MQVNTVKKTKLGNFTQHRGKDPERAAWSQPHTGRHEPGPLGTAVISHHDAFKCHAAQSPIRRKTEKGRAGRESTLNCGNKSDDHWQLEPRERGKAAGSSEDLHRRWLLLSVAMPQKQGQLRVPTSSA